ncbi:hypothetical protein [Candidatus Leptofilum sp.]|uniref:hypothetical protein n=1 Tax=Candidatus Leptofilum sp. TaxID=3241576 RepID=UPI003B5C583E
MRIKVPTFVIVITFLTGLIATVLGLWAWFSPDSFSAPSGVGAPTHSILSWGARELAMALSSWIAIFMIKDARAYAVALGSALLRESLDFIDAFRIADTPARLFIIVGVSVILHAIALFLTFRAIQQHKTENP